MMCHMMCSSWDLAEQTRTNRFTFLLFIDPLHRPFGTEDVSMMSTILAVCRKADVDLVD